MGAEGRGGPRHKLHDVKEDERKGKSGILVQKSIPQHALICSFRLLD